MKTIITAALAAAFALGLMACGDKDADEAAGKFKSLADKACKCADMDCYDKAREEFRGVEKGLKGKYKKKDDAPQSLRDAYDEAKSKMRECRKELRAKAKGGEKPAGDTPAPAPATP